MGGVAVIHPQACLKDHPDILLSTAMKSRRTIRFNPNYTNPPSATPSFIMSDSRRRTPPKGILKKDRNTEAVVAEPPAATASKNLVMGQVKILKRGEALSESSTILKDVNDRKVSNGAASTPPVSDKEASKVPTNGRRVSPTKKKAEKDRKMFSHSTPKIQVSKAEEFALSSTDRLGPDPEIVSKQMKNITEFFAGSAFSDSPPPSSVPLPGFFTKNFPAAVKDDATTTLRRILGLSLC